MNTRSFLCIAALSTSALATSPVPTSATPPSTPTTLGSASDPQAALDYNEMLRLQPAAGEKFDLSEIRQGMIELRALGKEVESNQQVQEKLAAYYASGNKGNKLKAQARSELKAVEKEVRSNQQKKPKNQEKKAALKAAIERDIKRTLRM